jgi:hypothetical protein
MLRDPRSPIFELCIDRVFIRFNGLLFSCFYLFEIFFGLFVELGAARRINAFHWFFFVE